MRHAEAVDDRFVGHAQGVVAGVDRGGRTGFVAEADGDAHGTLDARGEMRAIEIGCDLDRGGLVLGLHILGQLRPAGVATLLEAEQVGDRRHIHRAAREVRIQPAENETEAAALARAAVVEARLVHVRPRRDEIHRAVDAEDDAIIEIGFATGRARLAVARRAILRGEPLVLRVVKFFLRIGVRRGLERMHVHHEADEAATGHARVGTRHARPGTRYIDQHAERTRAFRHGEKTVDAQVIERREADAKSFHLVGAEFVETLHARVGRNLGIELLDRSIPECVEVGGPLGAGDNFLRADGHAINAATVVRANLDGRHALEDAGLVQFTSAGHGVALGEIESFAHIGLRAEVRERHRQATGLHRLFIRAHHAHREGRGHAARIHRVRMIRRDLHRLRQRQHRQQRTQTQHELLHWHSLFW